MGSEQLRADERAAHNEPSQLQRSLPIQDVRLVHDDYFDRIVAQTDVRTIIQHSPEFSAARELQEFMNSADIAQWALHSGLKRIVIDALIS